MLPDANYTREIPRLNEIDNVRTLGYVATDYGNKGLDAALAEINLYAGWAEQDAGMTLDGIFFDETPTHYDPVVDVYMQTVSQAVHQQENLNEGFVGQYVPGSCWCMHVSLAACGSFHVVLQRTRYGA